MKKLCVTALVLLFVAVGAYADVYVNWQAGAGFYFSADPGSGILGPGQSALAQLIWRPNNSGAFAGTDIANVNNANYVSGDDVWLADYTITSGVNTSEWGDFVNPTAYSDSGVLPDGGYVYARIFETDTVVLGSRYYVGPVVAANDLDSSDPIVTAQTYEMNRDLVSGDALDGTFGFEAVPEPGTIGMLALGLVTVAGGAARKRRKAAVEA